MHGPLTSFKAKPLIPLQDFCRYQKLHLERQSRGYALVLPPSGREVELTNKLPAYERFIDQ